MAQREAQIEQALEAIRTNTVKSIREAQRAYGIPESTLRARLSGTTNRRMAHQYRKSLSIRQEEFLVEWILEQEAQGFPPSHARCREMATRILRMNGNSQELGIKFVRKFIRDNPRIASVVGRSLESARVNGTNPEAIQEFYTAYEDIIRRFNIQPCNTWNMDEHGIAMGVCTNSYVLGSSEKSRSYVKSPESREWVSIIEVVSPTGGFTRPLVIFKGITPQTTHFPTDTPDWLYTTSENGWTTNSKGLSWLQTIFEPETRPQDGQWRLLIMDGHGSHTTIDFLWYCKQNKIHLLFLPAHTSHVLQPLDLGVFAPLKSRYRSQIAALSSLDDASPIKKQRFVTCYNLARKETFTPRLLKTGWQAAGIYPFNPSKGLNSSQVQTSKPHQSTPPPHPEIHTLFTTPKSSRHIHQATSSLRKKAGEKQALYQVLHKAGHAIDTLNTNQVVLEHRNTQLQAQLDQIATKRRRRVPTNPNTQFANIDTIIMAREAQAVYEAQEATKQARYDATAAARELEQQSFESLQFEWQIDNF
ncbi:hypothetical protein KCU67_g732, partial [Aureobasidium melanogenum]